jgi:hypothetical protein
VSAEPLATGLPRMGEAIEAKREADDEVLFSVTRIIDTLSKGEALTGWAIKETAERVVDSLDALQLRLEHEGREEAIAYVKGLRWKLYGRLSAKDLGSLAHGLFQDYALSGHRPVVSPDLHPKHASEGAELHPDDVRDLGRMLDRFDEFLQGYQPDYQSCEVVVYSPLEWFDDAGHRHHGYGYAGQCDAFLIIGGVRLIADYKTSRKTFDSRGKIVAPYPEVALQLAAYRYATHAAVWRARRYEANSKRFYLLSPAERDLALPVPEVDGGLAIRVTPDHLGVHPVRCDERDHETFLHVQEAAGWLADHASHVVGNEMPPLVAPPVDDPFAGLPEE